MRKFTVTGMSCAACSARVEKAVSAVDGVNSCSVNLLTNTLLVDGTAPDDAVKSAVIQAGYGIAENTKSKSAPKSETKTLVFRLVSSLLLTFVLMLFSMGKMIGINLDIPPLANAITQMLISISVIVINKKFFISGGKAVLSLAPNMDTIVALGSLASLGYSVVRLYMMTLADSAAQHEILHDLYFESAAMILALITLGKMLESYSKGKTTNALKSLMDLAPKTAILIVDGKEKTVAVEDIKKGDVVAVYPGASVPVDCVIISGATSVDESSLTGESMPQDKASGDSLYASSVNLSGYVTCEATRVGEDTTLANVIRMVSDASATKAPISRLADKVSGIFVPIVIGIALVTFAVWSWHGYDAGFALARAISVLVISCPCALGLATPVAVMVASGVGAKNNILFKNGAAIEHAGKIKNVVLDKTGTVTNGTPEVTDVITENDRLLSVAAALECKSEHPLATAIMKYVKGDFTEAQNVKALAGSGIEGSLDGKILRGGKPEYIDSFATVPTSVKTKIDAFYSQGKTCLAFSEDSTFLGVIAVADTVKPDSKNAISELKKMGITVTMLTGDNEQTAKTIAKSVGITNVIAGVLPDGKADAVNKIKQSGITAMVGDGINDAPALTTSDVGIAIGAGTDIAIDSADIVLMKSSLKDAVTAVRLGRKTLANIRENLFWAFIYNVIGIPVAAGVFINAFGWELSPMLGAAAMSLSSFCVVSNALRLNLFKPKKEKKNMKITLKIEGMMCPHCENRVKTTLESLGFVDSAEVSHKTGTAVVTLNKETDKSELISVVEAQGYKVIG